MAVRVLKFIQIYPTTAPKYNTRRTKWVWVWDMWLVYRLEKGYILAHMKINKQCMHFDLLHYDIIFSMCFPRTQRLFA